MSTTSKTSKTSKTSAASKVNMVNNCNPDTGVSLCIPRVFNNIGWFRIKKVMISCDWGFIDRVDVIPCGAHKRAFIHFAPGKWNMRSSEARDVLEALKVGGEVQIVYEEGKPWFWKIRASGSKKPEEAPKARPRPAVKISTQIESSGFKSYDATAQQDEELREVVASIESKVPSYDDIITLPSEE